MLQRIRPLLTATALLVLACLPGCRDDEDPPATRPADGGRAVRVASLIPAVTNMLLELGEAEALVAVSNYDTDPRVESLPRVGDLLTIDWEQIAAAQPTHMIVQLSPEKIPPGARERAAEMDIQIVSVQLTTLDDIERALGTLQRELAPESALSWSVRFRDALDANLTGVLGDPPDPARLQVAETLIALSPDLEFVVGYENYLNDLLKGAGGSNVLPGRIQQPYPRLDREMLLSLRPTHLILILPDAAPAQVEEARRALENLEPAWGLAWEDVLLVTDPYAMAPGWSVVDLHRRMVEHLLASPVTRPAR